MTDHVTYQDTFFKAKSIKKVAKLYLKNLPLEVDGLMSTGSSGCAIASAMLVLSKQPLVHTYFRKEKENAHGGSLIRQYATKWAIVDDFIVTGRTIQNIISRVSQREKITCIIVDTDTSGIDFGIPVITITKRKN
jgi:orotate phosphoribosyltransferase-like protein